MKHFYETVANQSNVLIPGASVTVFVAGTNIPAQLFSDAGVTPKANPVTTNALGVFDFYIADGRYDIQVSGPNIATFKQLGVEISDVTQASASDTSWQTEQLNFVNQGGDPPIPPLGNISLYTKGSPKHIFIEDDAGTITDLTSGGGGGGGGLPAAPTNSLQKNSGASAFASSNIVDTGTLIDVNSNVAFKGPNPHFDVTQYGVRYLTAPQATTATCTASSTSVTLASAADFINGDGIYLGQCGPATLLSTPAAPSSVNQRAVANGATTRSYAVVAEDFSLGLTAASLATSNASTAAILGGFVTATTASVSTTNGVTTLVTSANHNLAVGAQILVGTNNGVYQVLSVPTPTSFTIQASATGTSSDQGSLNTALSITVASHIQIYWTGQANVMRYWVYRQDNGSGNFNLIGVAQGAEPFYDDYGWPAPTAPVYVPLTAPATATNQSIATTIVSGGGTTTITVTNAASNSISGVQALHDDTVAMRAAYAQVAATTGGRLYVPRGGCPTFNFPLQIGGSTPVQIEIAGCLAANQPIIPASWVTFTGVNDSSGASPSFAKSYAALIGGPAYPLVLLRGQSSSNIVFDRIRIFTFLEQQWGILGDNTFGAGGPVQVDFYNSNFIANHASGIPVVLRGVGFGHTIKNNTFGNQNGVFYTQGTLRLMGSAIAVPTGIPGIGELQTNTFLTNGVRADTDALNGAAIANVGSPWTFSNSFSEGLVSPAFDIRNISSNNWFNWAIDRSYNADSITGAMDVDTTGSCCITGLFIDGIGGGTGGASINLSSLGGSGLFYVSASPFESINPGGGYAGLPYSAVNFGVGIGNYRTFETDGGLRLKGTTAAAFSELLPPTNVVALGAAGGSIPIGTWTYVVVSQGWNGGETNRSNRSLPVVITSGNQTVNITWTASGIGTAGYNVYRSNGGGFARVNGSLITTTSFSDTFQFPQNGTSLGIASGTGSTYINAAEISSPQLRVPSQSGLFSSAISGTFTAPRAITMPDASGILQLQGAGGSGGVTLAGVPNTSINVINANTTAFQNLSTACASPPCFSSGSLNALGKTIDVTSQGITSFVNTTESVTLSVDFGSGPTNFGFFTPASTGNSTWFLTLQGTVTTTGAFGQMFCSLGIAWRNAGGLTVQIGGSQFVPINLTSTITPTVVISFSTASTANVTTTGLTMTHLHN